MVLTVLLPIGLALAAYFTVSRTKADVGNTTQGQLYFSNTVGFHVLLSNLAIYNHLLLFIFCFRFLLNRFYGKNKFS